MQDGGVRGHIQIFDLNEQLKRCRKDFFTWGVLLSCIFLTPAVCTANVFHRCAIFKY